MAKWYYVENGERQGPITEDELTGKIQQELLEAEDYVWKKGFDNWKKVKEINELVPFLDKKEEKPTEEVAEPNEATTEEKVKEKTAAESESEPEVGPEEKPKADESPSFDWSQIPFDQRKFTVRIGKDRGAAIDTEYGPFSVDILKRLFSEKRINGKKLIFCPGMPGWEYLAQVPFYQDVFGETPPPIEQEEQDKRQAERKPFVARMFFHNQSQLFEGTCRDISVGGMQVLIHNFPGKVGEKISINVHPENSDYCFVASGSIVRLLEGGQGFSFRFTNLNDEAKQAIENYIGGE